MKEQRKQVMMEEIKDIKKCVTCNNKSFVANTVSTICLGCKHAFPNQEPFNKLPDLYKEGLKAESIKDILNTYLLYCKMQKCLDQKTIKAYRIDLTQFITQMDNKLPCDITSDDIEQIIRNMHEKFKSKTAKRKIAAIRAFFHYMEQKEKIKENPFHKIDVRFREPKKLPKTIPLEDLNKLFIHLQAKYDSAIKSNKGSNKARQELVVLKTLFCTGMRVSELTNLSEEDINLNTGQICIYGKGSKERIIEITNQELLNLLIEYNNNRDKGKPFFNMSSQKVRYIIKKNANEAGLKQNITPHMFRHTFATTLLESDVDIRYIQSMLGHSSINTTQIYTHVSTAKQREILQKNDLMSKLK